MNKMGTLQWLAKTLNKALWCLEAEVVEDHVEIKMDGNIVKIRITISKEKK
jgi:hypothetical protein